MRPNKQIKNQNLKGNHKDEEDLLETKTLKDLTLRL